MNIFCLRQIVLLKDRLEQGVFLTDRSVSVRIVIHDRFCHLHIDQQITHLLLRNDSFGCVAACRPQDESRPLDKKSLNLPIRHVSNLLPRKAFRKGAVIEQQ